MVSTPLKHISQMGVLFPIYGKIKNVQNHQPDNVRYEFENYQAPVPTIESRGNKHRAVVNSTGLIRGKTCKQQGGALLSVQAEMQLSGFT